ncbi:MAG: FKBP-type peptidyl-prolyl cis-trans isomerase [Minisyncoccales bacterium]
MVAKNGDTVLINYEGKLENGEVFDSSEKHGQPLQFTLGEGMVIQGFEDAVKDMEKGQKKEFEISPEEGYGEIVPELVKEIPKSALPEPPEGQEIKEGMTLMLSSPDGRQFPAKISEVKDEAITLDLNHPLAGKKLLFNVELVEIRPAEEKQENSESEESAENIPEEKTQDISEEKPLSE